MEGLSFGPLFIRAAIECFPSFQDLLAPKVTHPKVITISMIHSNHSFPTEISPVLSKNAFISSNSSGTSFNISQKSNIQSLSSKYVNQVGIRLNYNLS